MHLQQITCLNAVIISRVTVCFITLPPLTLTSIKTTDVTHKYAQFLKIVILALAQERVIFNFSINSTFPCKKLKFLVPLSICSVLLFLWPDLCFLYFTGGLIHEKRKQEKTPHAI